MKTFKPDTCNTLHTVEIGMAVSAPAFFTEKTTVFSYFKLKLFTSFFLTFLFSVSCFNTVYSQEYYERLLECGNNRLIDEYDDLNFLNEEKLVCTYNTDCYGPDGRECDPPSNPCGKMRIPIAISIITDGAGAGAINQDDLNANLAEVNAMYANANMEFFECVPRRNIDNADLYDFDDDDASNCAALGVDDDDDQLDPLDIPGAINLYFVEDPERCGNVVCGYAPYPGNSSMHSVMNNSCIGSGESTLAHELGHYFGLYHTHDGNTNAAAPINNSSDCCTTGDQICDTGADPKSNTDATAMAQCLFSVNDGCDCYTTPPNNTTNCANGLGNCVYNGPTGPTGYNPDVGNIMSYNPWGGCVRDHFSPCQLAKMYDVLFECRMDLCCVPDPPTASDPPTICYGDPLTNLTADILGNDNRTKENNCVTWYSDAAGTNVLSNQTPSYQPVYGNGPGEISGPGTYTYYAADVGVYNPDCSSDLTEITVIVEACAACPVITAVDTPVDGCSGTTQTICVTYDQDPTGLVTADINGTVGTINGFAICYDITLPGNMTCSPVTLDFVHSATCVADASPILNTAGENTNGSIGVINVFPVAQNPTDGIVGCANTPTPACVDDTFATVATNSTGGAAIANWDGTTYTAQPGDAAGSIDVEVTTVNGCTETFTITTPECPAECPAVIDESSAVSICSGTLSNEITVWQTALEATNSAAISDANTDAAVTYSTPPTNSNLTCSDLPETMTATLNCFGLDGVDDSGANDDILLTLGTFTLTTFPAAQNPADGIVGCANTPTPACVDDTFATVATNSTGGAAIANWDGTTYTAQPGDAAGSIDVEVRTVNGCTETFTITTPECPAECPAVIDESSAVSICSGTLSNEITVWQTAVEATNSAAISDANTDAAVTYSTPPTNSNLTCSDLPETMTATLNCFGLDGVDDSGANDDVLLTLGTFTLTTFPAAQNPTDDIVGCTNTPVRVCVGDTFGAVGGTTGGASAGNWDGTTYTAQPGDAAGTIDVELITANGCTETFTITTPACPLPPCDEPGLTSADICANLTVYGALDCDGGGVDNATECNGPDGDPATPDGTDPLDPCDDPGLTSADICANLAIYGALDCDGGGVDNATECNGPDGDPATQDGTNPLDPCDDPGLTSSLICGNLALYGALDCDGGGIDNATECANGGDPLDDTDECAVALAAGVNICAELLANPGSPLATLDCDEAGVDNLTECNGPDGDPATPDGSDPLDSCDDPGLTSADICGNLVLYGALDCDGGGVDNATECADGGDPLNPDDDDCDLNIICPPDTTILCTENISMLSDSMLYVLIGGNPNGCDSLTITSNGFTDPGPCGGDVDVMFSVTVGTTTIDCSSTITVAPAPPTITCPLPNIVDVACLEDVVADTLEVVAIANCGAAIIGIQVDTIPGAFNSTCGQRAGDSYRIQYTATDNCGQSATCEQTFVIENNPTPIVLSCPADTVLITCKDEVVVDVGLIGFTTICGVDAIVTAELSPATANSDCGELPDDEYVVEYKITDDCNRIARCFQTFIITNPEPVIISCPADTTVACLSDVTANLAAFEYTSCRDSLVIASDTIPLAGNSPCGQLDGDQYTITYTVVDSCQIDTFCIQTFTIDSDEPTITCPADTVTVACFTDIVTNAADAVVTTACGLGSTAVTIDGPIVGDRDCPGTTYTYTYSVEDDCGRVASCDQVFIIANDSLTIACPADTTVACFTDIAAGTATTTISCGIESGIETSDPALISGTAECPGAEYEIVYTVTDSCGRVADCAQRFTIANDSLTIACPADIVVTCEDDIVAGTATTTTSCGLESGVSTSERTLISGTGGCSGAEYGIVYTVTDSCGRTADCTQIFTIVNDGPGIVCPMDTTVTCFTDIVAGTPTVATSCGLGSEVEASTPTLISGTADCPGAEYEIVYTVTDSCGRVADCAQIFTIANDGPTIVCPDDGVVACEDDIEAGTPTVTTSCGLGSDISTSGPTLVSGTADCPNAEYEIVYTVTDSCGRVADCIQTFRIVNDGPTIACPDGAVVTCEADIAASTGTPTVTTSCGLESGISTSGPTLVSGTADCPGAEYEIVYTVTDSCGRVADCIQTFRIVNDGPTIACPDGAVVTCEADIVEGTPTVTTSCGLGSDISTSGPTLVSGTADCPNAEYEIVYTVTDSCGRTADCTQIFTIANDEPVITCPAGGDVTCFADIVVGDAVFTTSCGVSGDVVVTGPEISGTPDCNTTQYTYTHTGTDACGRVAACQQVFTIINDPPTIICPEDCPVACESDIRPGTPEFTTSCGLTGTVTVSDPVIVGDPGCDGTTYTYTYTVSDGCDRTASCGQTFTIVNDCHRIDFDYDDNGNQLPPGTDMFDQYNDFTITTEGHLCAQLFDTGSPTSGDFDLGTPNEQYGGPGIGAGGDNNTTFQGNALIASYDCGVPNEKEGKLIFDFACSVTIKTVDLLDMKCADSEVELYDEHGNRIAYLDIPAYGVNSFNVFDVHVSGVYQMIIDLDCGGGVTGFKYCKDNTPGANCGAGPTCEDYHLDFSDNGNHWAMNDMSGSFDIDGQVYDISIADADGILVDTEENGSGLQVGIDPHNVNDEVIICYNLSQISDNVVFDITDLDKKDGNSRQQEAVCVYGLLGNDPTRIMPLITDLDGSVDIDDNCAEATTNSAYGHDESVLVEFSECIDKVVIVYGTGSDSPTVNPSYSSIIIGASVGFNSEVCPGDCLPSCDGVSGSGSDDDGDGVCNDLDVCEGGDDNQDRDGDGIPDACDDICYDYNIDHGDCGAAWGHDDTSGSVELGLETVDITIVDDDNIFVDSEAVGAGLQVGIDPHNVNDELVLCYNLSNSSSNVVFDIADLDLKDSNSRQQEKVCVYGTLGADPTQILPTVTSLDGAVSITDNCGEGTTNSAHSGKDESILVEFTECIDKITIVYGTGSQSPTNNPTYSKIVIGGSVFTIEQCKGGCDEPCTAGSGSGGGDGDSDGDGVCDDQDICEGGDDNQDADGDGKPDFCDDDCTVGGSSARGDDDGDFVCNDEDQCEGFDDNIDTNNNGVPDCLEENCDDYVLDFEEDGYTWTGHNLMESYTVGSQTFDINIIDGDNILDRTHENGSGIAIATNPHSVDDNVVICYNLSEVSNNVIFDIVDLDYKDNGSRQQEAVCVYGTLGADPTQILPMITSLEGAVSITDNCAEATANSAVSGQDESILVEFTECIDKVTIVYGTGSSSPTANPDYGKITIGKDYGFSTEVCTNACVTGSPREDESNANISLYPNPVYGSNSVTVEIDTEARGDAQIVLVDALGRTIHTQGIELVNNITNHQISTEKLPSGIYFVQLHTAAWRTNGMKLVVVKP